MKKKKLILFYNDPRENNIFLNKLSEIENVEAKCVFKPVNKLFRMVRRLHIKSGLPGLAIWFLDWKKQINDFDIVISIASPYSYEVLKWVDHNSNNTRIINYFWDSIEISKYPLVKQLNFENWSFFENECEKYELKYNPQFFVSNMLLPKSKILYDIVYVGADRNGILKHRTFLINQYYKKFKNLSLKLFFYYFSNDQSIPNDIRKSKLLTETEYYKITSESKAILDIVEPNVQWMTLRPLLAMSNQKKLITNNKMISNEVYYKPQNIFILEIDDISTLPNFVNSPFVPIDKELEFYDAVNWLKRFEEE